MATSKPRITVTLSERQHQVLKIISDCGGQSMSSLLGELIEVSLPTFERMANTFQRLSQVKTAERAKMLQAMDEAQSALEPIANAAVDQFDLFLCRIEEASGVLPDAPRGALAAPQMPTPVPRTNRGVTPTGAKQPKARQCKVSRPSSSQEVSRKKSG